MVPVAFFKYIFDKLNKGDGNEESCGCQKGTGEGQG